MDESLTRHSFLNYFITSPLTRFSAHKLIDKVLQLSTIVFYVIFATTSISEIHTHTTLAVHSAVHLGAYYLGFASITVPIYIAESTPPNLRGPLVSLNQAFISGGMFISLIVSGSFCPVKMGWR